MEFPLTAGYHIKHNALGARASADFEMLSGGLRAWINIWYLFGTYRDSWTIFKWSGIEFYYTIYESCYCDDSVCSGVSSRASYGAKRRLLSTQITQAEASLSTHLNFSRLMQRRLLGTSPAACDKDPSL